MNAFVIRKPVVTEKSMLSAKTQRAYTFVVDPLATKAQVAEAVENTFGVTVIKVNMASIAGKKKRSGKSRKVVKGEKKKKAIVTLKVGQKIALFEVEG